MKRAALSIALLALLPTAAPAQRRETDRDVDGLKGTVSSVVTEVASYKLVSGESVEQSRRPSEQITYDPGGNRLELKEYDEEGRLRSTKTGSTTPAMWTLAEGSRFKASWGPSTGYTLRPAAGRCGLKGGQLKSSSAR